MPGGVAPPSEPTPAVGGYTPVGGGPPTQTKDPRTPIDVPQGTVYGQGTHGVTHGVPVGVDFGGKRGVGGIPITADQGSTYDRTAYGTTARGPAGVGVKLVNGQYVGGTDFYMNGEEWAPLDDPSRIPDLQVSLIQAGWLDPRKTVIGRWDEQSAGAWRSILAFANHTGMTKDDALKFWVQHPKGTAGGGSAASQPGPFELHNKEDVQAAYRSAAESLVGGDLSKDEAKRFSDQYQADERRARQAQADAMTGGKLTYTLPPDPSNAADTYIRAHHMDKVVGYGMAARMQEFFGMLKGV